MLELKVFVLEFVAINRCAPGAVVTDKVAALNHKVGNDSMKAAALVGHFASCVTLSALANGLKVLDCFWNNAAVQTQHNSSSRVVVNGDVKVDT